jgi:intermembrane space import and assembly protein 40
LFKQAEPQSEKPVHASNARHDEPELESVPSGGPSESQSEEEVAKTDEDGEPPASEGAYNPETGEINWDCPCLGGMADGPCGPEFREAFSCFIYSEDEPKGINCVEKFQGMQTCFREHPEVYASGMQNSPHVFRRLT